MLTFQPDALTLLREIWVGVRVWFIHNSIHALSHTNDFSHLTPSMLQNVVRNSRNVKFFLVFSSLLLLLVFSLQQPSLDWQYMFVISRKRQVFYHNVMCKYVLLYLFLFDFQVSLYVYNVIVTDTYEHRSCIGLISLKQINGHDLPVIIMIQIWTQLGLFYWQRVATWSKLS